MRNRTPEVLAASMGVTSALLIWLSAGDGLLILCGLALVWLLGLCGIVFTSLIGMD